MAFLTMPLFSGTDPEAWISVMERSFYNCQILPSHYVEFAMRYLDGEALTWARLRELLFLEQGWGYFVYRLLWEFATPYWEVWDNAQQAIVKSYQVHSENKPGDVVGNTSVDSTGTAHNDESLVGYTMMVYKGEEVIVSKLAADSPTSMVVDESSLHPDQSSIEISVVETHCAQSGDCVQSFLIPNDHSVNTGNTVSILQNLNVKFQAPAEVESQGSNVDEDHELIPDSFVAYDEIVIDDITLMKQQTARENVGAFLFDNGFIAASCSFESEHKAVLAIYVLRFFDYNIVSCLPEISQGSLQYPWCFDPGIIRIWLCRCEEMLFNVLGDISELAKIREAKKYSTKIVSQGEEFAFLMKIFVCPEFHAVCDYGLTWKHFSAIYDIKM